MNELSEEFNTSEKLQVFEKEAKNATLSNISASYISNSSGNPLLLSLAKNATLSNISASLNVNVTSFIKSELLLLLVSQCVSVLS